MNKEKEQKEIPNNSRKKLTSILADSAIEITFNGEKTHIRALRTYSKYKILEVMENIIHTDSDMLSVLKEASSNIECAARIVAICLCNHKFTPDYEANDAMIEKTTKDVMLNSTSESEWATVVVKALESLNIEAVFQITALVDLMTKSLVGRRGMAQKAISEA